MHLMSQHFDVCIRGGGVVGRTLALLLAREKLRVALVAQPALPGSSGHSDVRAYALNSASKQLLQGLRAWPEGNAVTPVKQMQIWNGKSNSNRENKSTGESQLDFNLPDDGQTALAWIVDVPSLEHQLTQASRFQPQIEIVESPVQAALQVVCEGQKSSSRHEFGTTWTTRPYPQKAIAARLESDKPHLGVARQWFKNGEILALLPISGAQGNSVALVWSVSVERADKLLQLGADAFAAALQADCGELPGRLKLASERAGWPLALSKADRWVGPGWALAGDAAHTVHPLAGQGLNLGLADVTLLADVIAKREYWRGLGDEKLLRRYERARKADVAAMGLVTDQLHGVFAQTDERWQALRGWGMKSFANSGPLKAWVTRRAAGT